MTRVDRGRSAETLATAFLLAMTIMHSAVLLHFLPLLGRGYQDFTIFYTAGTMTRQGRAAQLYDLAAQTELQREFAPDVPTRAQALPFNHPPFEALVFWPLAFFGYQQAYWMWTLLNVAFLFLTLAQLRHLVSGAPGSSLLFLALAAAGFFPIAEALIQGQDTILLLLCLVSGLAFLKRNRDIAGGAMFALALFKFHLLVPIAVLIALRRPRMLLGLIPAAAALVAISVTIVGWHGAEAYMQFVLNLESTGAGGAIRTEDMPNLRGFLANLPGIALSPRAATILIGLTSAAVFLVAAAAVRRQRGSLISTFAIASVTAVLIGFHTLLHDLAILLPAALFLYYERRSGTASNRSTLALLLTLYTTPLYFWLWFRLHHLCWFAFVLVLLLWVLLRISRSIDRELPNIPAAPAIS